MKVLWEIQDKSTLVINPLQIDAIHNTGKMWVCLGRKKERKGHHPNADGRSFLVVNI